MPVLHGQRRRERWAIDVSGVCARMRGRNSTVLQASLIKSVPAPVRRTAIDANPTRKLGDTNMRMLILTSGLAAWIAAAPAVVSAEAAKAAANSGSDFIQTLFVFMLATFIGLGVVSRV